MLRSAASPGSVGFGRPRGGVSGLLIGTASGRPPMSANYFREFAGALDHPSARAMTPPWAASLDLRLAKFHVLPRDRIVFLLRELLGHVARILLGHVIEAGV